VAIDYEEEELARAAVEVGRRLCMAAVNDTPFDIGAEVEKLKEINYDAGLGPSTKSIVRAAKRRGIPVRRLNRESLVQLGQGAKARRICTAETDRTSAIAESIAQDKQLTRMLLASIGVPVPVGRPVASMEEAWQVAQEIGVPVVVKPQFGNHGRGVATNLTTRDQVFKAYEAAKLEGRHILVETYAPGVDHRLLVIGNHLVAAAHREPAQVVGDGQHTIRELVAEVNKDPRRSDGHSTVLSFIKLDAIAWEVLAEQGHSPDTVPAAGERVLIRRNGNLSTGGTAADVTERVHPDVAARAVEAARIVGLDISGVDVVCEDISRPLEAQRGAIVEVNAGPGLRMHLQPSAGSPRPVGEAIVDMLFPPGDDGRIPIISIAGGRGAAMAARLTARLLRQGNRAVGLACEEGVYVNERLVDARDGSGAASARALLLNPAVELAVLETSTDGILREGLGYDRSDVGIVLGVERGSPPATDEDALAELARAPRTVIEAVKKGGFGILNAADPLVAAMAEACRGEIILLAASGEPAALTEHIARGGRAVVLRQGRVVLVTGGKSEELDRGGKPKPLAGENPESLLAAVATAWALEMSPGDILTRLVGQAF
jgi:cyanophycin synthetase